MEQRAEDASWLTAPCRRKRQSGLTQDAHSRLPCKRARRATPDHRRNSALVGSGRCARVCSSALFGIAIASITALAATERPDPSIPNGDPCCWHPDTWAEVAGGLTWAAGTVLACAALVYVAIALGKFAWSGTWRHLRRGRRLGLAVSYIGIWLVMLLELG
jgi:hypothetical protein